MQRYRSQRVHFKRQVAEGCWLDATRYLNMEDHMVAEKENLRAKAV